MDPGLSAVPAGNPVPLSARRTRLRRVDAGLLRVIALNLITMLLSLSVHEYCHARVADWLGDDTPRRQGRLTLSPLAHYDVFGTFIIPIVALLLAGGFALIGWARPVETVPANYTRKVTMKSGEMLVAVAGPLSNLALAFAAMVGLASLLYFDPALALRQDTGGALVYLLHAMVLVNIGLGVFNLIPLPPLDGSRLLPRRFDDLQRAIAPISFFLLLLILNVPVLRQIFIFPVTLIARLFEAVFGIPLGLYS
jgi:Zn-dependent protease